MRVTMIDRRAAARTDELEPALGAGEAFERREHRGWIAAGRDCESGRDQRVFDLEFADQRQPHAKRSIREHTVGAASPAP